MSQEVVENIIRRAATDSAFRKKLSSEPNAALEEYKDKLTDAERAALKAIKNEVMEGFAAVLKKEERPWWQPASFKELGGALLSLFLIGLLLYAAWQTYGLINVTPQTYDVGDNTQVVDTFSRAKDLLNILFPLLSAVVTFWLGVAVEGRRADDLSHTADQEREERLNAEAARADAENTARKTTAALAATTAGGKAAIMALQKAARAKRPAEAPDFEALLAILEEGEKAIPT